MLTTGRIRAMVSCVRRRPPLSVLSTDVKSLVMQLCADEVISARAAAHLMLLMDSLGCQCPGCLEQGLGEVDESELPF